MIIGNFAILYDKNNVAYEYNPRVSAIHYEKDMFSNSMEKVNEDGAQYDIKFTGKNYQPPVQCLDKIPVDNIENVLSSRGTIFIYKDNNPNVEMSTIFGI